VRVLLIDDHEMFRQGLKFLLSDLNDSLQYLEAGNCDQALALIASETISLILLDLNMPGTKKGLDALQAISEAAPAVPVAVLSGENDPTIIRAAIDAGASGFVPKSSSSEILVAALQLILAGGVYLPNNVLAVADAQASREGQFATGPGLASQLSDRQTAVLLLAIQGQANKVIAYDLGIAEGTVKTHLSAAYRVLGVHNRTEAVYAAAKLGLKPFATSFE
jgi:DNA-binding NarL/FixJ family response regulator